MSSTWPGSAAFWSNKPVMVTGGNGFLGQYIVRKLHERGASVFVADLDRYGLRQPEDIRRALDDSKPNIVIHHQRSGCADLAPDRL
jgi:GDP-L-fucose synthase